MNLRPYQTDAIKGVFRHLHRNPILVSPTGSGKTVMAVHIARTLNARALWLAHRRELIDQARQHLMRLGLHVGVIMGTEPVDLFAKYQVASVQTLTNRAIPECDLVIVDECHHARADSYQAVFQFGVPVIGLTATPFRLDGQGLGDLFGEIVVSSQVADLVEAGFLHRPRVFSKPASNFSKFKVRRGDFVQSQTLELMEQESIMGDIVHEWFKHARELKTVCFAINVQHSRHIVERFRQFGISAEHIDGSTPTAERDAILARLASGKTTIVSNCMVLTEGWDLPSLECAIIARPTASLNLHLQMIGRTMRSCDGKNGAVVLDHAGNCVRLGDVTQRLEYSLDAKPERLDNGAATGLRTCQACGLMFPCTETICPGCEFEHGYDPRTIKCEPGELVEFRVTPSHEDKAAFWDELMRERMSVDMARWKFKHRFGSLPTIIDGKLLNSSDTSMSNKRAVYRHYLDVAKASGYKIGWARHAYRTVFGVWPTRMKDVEGGIFSMSPADVQHQEKRLAYFMGNR